MAEFRRPFFREQGNRQPLRGRVDLGVSAPPQTRPGGVIAPDRPTTPTQPRPDVPEQRPEKPNHTGRNIALAGTGLLGLGGAAVWTAYETIPAFHQMVDQAFLSHLRGDQLVSTDIKSDTIFDNEAEKGKVGKDTLTDRSLSEIMNSLQNGSDQNPKAITMTWPIDFKEGEKIPYERPHSPWRVTEELRAQVANGVRPEITFSLNKGDVLKAPMFVYKNELPTEYRAILVRNGPDVGGEDTNMTGFGRLFLYYPNANITMVIMFHGEGVREEDVNFTPLIPMRGNEDWNGLGWKNFQSMDPNTQILQATKDQKLTMSVEGFQGQTIGGIPQLVDKTSFVVTPNFLPDENGTITNLKP